MGEFVVDPRVFIQPPYLACTNCGTENAFGVLIIGWGYTRRCRECWHTDRFDLPEIRKTVIYLDQLAISEMMKALTSAVPHPWTGRRVLARAVRAARYALQAPAHRLPRLRHPL